MADFKSALQEGLAAFDRSEADKREIAKVIRDFSSQTAEFTDNTIKVDLRRFRISSTMAEAVGLTLGSALLTRNRIALCFVSQTKDEDYQELADWSTTDGGYPLTLKFDDLNITCHDKESLEQTLIRLVATPSAGKALASLKKQIAVPPSSPAS